MLTPPIGDLVVVVAASDRSARDEEQDLAQRIPDLAGFARVSHGPEMIEQKPQAVLDQNGFHDGRSQTNPNRHESRERPSRYPSQPSVNLNSLPWFSSQRLAAGFGGGKTRFDALAQQVPLELREPRDHRGHHAANRIDRSKVMPLSAMTETP